MMNQQEEDKVITEEPTSSELEKEENPCNSSPVTTSSKVFQIDVILSHILEYVPNNQLISCRLVDHKWNSIILTKLNSSKQQNSRRGGWIIPITSKNIQGYIAFIKSNPKIATTTTESTTQFKSTVPLSVTIHKYYDNSTTYGRIINGLHTLVELFNSGNFVTSFSIASGQSSTRFKSTVNWTKLFELISRLAPGLQSLVIDEDLSEDAIASIELPGLLTSFPKLRFLKYTSIVKNPGLLGQIVNAAPNLRTLLIFVDPAYQQQQPTLDHPTSGISGYTLCNQMVSNAYSGINSSSCSQLDQLTLILFGDSSFTSIQHWRLPKLKKLTLGLRNNLSSGSGRILSKFLTQSCPVLSSLQFEYMYNPDGVALNFPNGPAQSEFPSGLPPLPKLTHFGYSDVHFSSSGLRYPNFIRLHHLLDPMSMFPSLSSVSIELGSYLYWSGAFALFNNQTPPTNWTNNPSLIRHLCFDGVSSLNLIIKKNIRFEPRPRAGLPRISLADAANQYKLLFPNTTKLRIDNQIRPTERELSGVKNALKAILLQLLDQLECLEITNYIQDWLCEFLVEDGSSEEFGTKFHNLKTLIIPSIEKSYNEIITSHGACIGHEGREFARVGAGVHGVVLDPPPPPVPTMMMALMASANDSEIEVNVEDTDDDDESDSDDTEENSRSDNDDNFEVAIDLTLTLQPNNSGIADVPIMNQAQAPQLPQSPQQQQNPAGFQNNANVDAAAAKADQSLALRQVIWNILISQGFQPIIESVGPSLNLNLLLPYLPSIQLLELGKEFLVAAANNANQGGGTSGSGTDDDDRIILQDIIKNLGLRFPQVNIQLI